MDVLGAESNGMIWPTIETIGARGTHSDDEDEDEEVADELETPQNLRLLRIGVLYLFFMNHTGLMHCRRRDTGGRHSAL